MANLADEFEAPKPVDLSTEFETPAPVKLVDEFQAPAAYDIAGAAAKRKTAAAAPAPAAESGPITSRENLTGANDRSAVTGLTPAEAQTRGEEGQVALGRGLIDSGPTILRVGGPMAAAPFTAGMSLLPSLLVTAGGAALAELPAQTLEKAGGDRQNYSLKEGGINTAFGAIPGLRFANKAIVTPLARVAQVALRGVEGAAVTAGQDSAIRLSRGEKVTLKTAGDAALLGAGLGSVIGTGFDELARSVSLDRLFTAARGAGFKGQTVDDMRAWWQSKAPAEARNVTPTADLTVKRIEPATETPGAPAAKVPIAPEGGGTPAPGSAQAEFEKRAGMTPAAKPDPVNLSAEFEAKPAAVAPEAAPAEVVVPRETSPAATTVETTAPAGAEAQPPAPDAGAPSGSTAVQAAPENAPKTDGGQATETPAGIPEGVNRAELVRLSPGDAAARFGAIDPAAHKAEVLAAIGRGEKIPPAILRAHGIATKGKAFLNLAKFPEPKDGVPDLLNAIAELGGAPGPGRNAGGEYNGYNEAFSRGAARLLRRKASGGIDTLLGELSETGYHFNSVDELYSAVSKAVDTRLRVEAHVIRQNYEGKVQAAIFDNKGRKPHQTAPAPMSSDELAVGTTFRIRGEPFEVIDVNPDTGAAVIKGGTTMEIPAGTAIYPDKGSLTHAPKGNDNAVFEPPALWNAGLAGSNRYRTLSEKAIAGTLTDAERAELAGFEAKAGQTYVPGSMDAAAIAGDAARQAAALKAKQATEIRTKAEARLLGGNLETQDALFGTAPGETGMLFEGTEAAVGPFLDRIGIAPGGLRNLALHSINNLAQRIARLEFALPYDLPSISGGIARLVRTAAGNPGRALSARAGNAAIAAAPWLADPVKYAGPLTAALHEHGRISSIVADYFTGQLPEWNPIGKTIVTPQDVVALMAPLRSPYAESFKAVVVDVNNRVIHAEVLHIGDLTSSVASVQAVVRAVERAALKTSSRRVIISHNHPSGDPSPSTPDWKVHELMRESLADANIHLVDDVVTNGHSGYSLSQNALFEMEYPPLAPWELVSRKNLAKVQDSDRMKEIAGALRQSNPEAAFVIYLNNRHGIVAIEQLPANADTETSLQLISRGTAREGANGVILGGRSFNSEMVAHISERMQARGARIYDVSTEDTPSWESSGLMPFPRRQFATAAEKTGQLREEPAEDIGAFDANAPIIVRSGRKGSYIKVPLEGLAGIPIVQMPELVRLTKLLTGQMPLVRPLRQALGQFGSADVSITLDPRIFRNSVIATKVLAHEFGHLADFLPDQTLARGNLLGRIASLKNYLTTTLPLDPKSGGQNLTDAERRALRKDAEKLAGPKPPADEEAERAAWAEAVAGHYAEKLQQELESRGLIVERGRTRGDVAVIGASKSLVGIREELIGVTQYWKPIPDNAPPAYVAYRLSGVELYADALSVLFNSPGTLKRLAPTFYEAFFNHLDAKPELKDALMKLYNFLNAPHLQVLNQRSRDIQQMFIKGDELILRKAAERKERYTTFRGWWDRFRQELFDVFDPLVSKGAALERGGKALPDRYNPRILFDEHPLADNANYEMVQRLWEKVVKPIEADGFTLNDLGEYLFLQRVLNERLVTAELPPGGVTAWKRAMTAAAYIHDPIKRAGEMQRLQEVLSEWEAGENNGRSGVANPLGTTAETARLGLLRMRLDAGWQRFARLELAANKFHDTVFEQIRAAVDVGVYSKQAFDERLAPNRQHYAAFAVLDHLEDYVPASIKMSQGTFKEIANPFTATVLKMVSVNRLIQTQKSKRGTVEFLQQFDAGSIAPAPVRHDGLRLVVQPPKDPDKALLELLVDGKPAGYHVDPAVAEMFDKLTPAHVSAVVRVLNIPFKKIIYPLIIKYNPAFQLVLGPTRDLRRTLVNVPKAKGVAQVGEFLRNYATFLGLPPSEAGAAVRAYLKGEPHELIAEMIATQAIGTPLDNFHADFGRTDTMEKILADFGMAPKEKQAGLLRTMAHPVMALLEKIEFAGLSFEMLPKVSVYKMLTRDLGWSTKEAAYFVRNSIGVPNIYRKGRHTAVAEVLFPFTKIFVNGWRSDARLALSPKTAGGWWARWAATDGMWTMMQAAAALGLLGVGIKELYDGISDYNKTNYNVLPIGSTEGGEFGKRVVYVRLPRDETHRLISGVFYQGLMLAGGEGSPKGASNILAFGAGQVPSLNPILTIAKGWVDYLEGENPKDNFRNSNVLSNAEYLAGGWPAMKSMIGFTADNMGVTNFIRWDPKANSTLEMTLSAVPGINRFIQTTATGYRERQEATLQAESAARAKLRLAMPANVQTLAGEYYHLRSVKASVRTIEQTTRLMELSGWMKRTYQPYEDLMSIGTVDAATMKSFEQASAAYERSR